MDDQERFIKYLLEVEEIGSEDKKEVVKEFFHFFKFGFNESSQAAMAQNGEAMYKSIGEMRLTNRWIVMLEDIKEKIRNPKPKGDES